MTKNFSRSAIAGILLLTGCSRQPQGAIVASHSIIMSSATVNGLAVTLPLKVPLSVNRGDVVQVNVQPTSDGEIIGFYINGKFTGETFSVAWKDRKAVE